MVALYIPDVPTRIRQGLIREARSRDVSVNEVAAGILAAATRTRREPTMSPYTPITRKDAALVVRVPAAVRHKLRVQAARDGVTISGLVKVALADALGVPAPDAKRKPRTTTR